METGYLPSYPEYFREPHWFSMGPPEISRVTWQVWNWVAVVYEICPALYVAAKIFFHRHFRKHKIRYTTFFIYMNVTLSKPKRTIFCWLYLLSDWCVCVDHHLRIFPVAVNCWKTLLGVFNYGWVSPLPCNTLHNYDVSISMALPFNFIITFFFHSVIAWHSSTMVLLFSTHTQVIFQRDIASHITEHINTWCHERCF